MGINDFLSDLKYLYYQNLLIIILRNHIIIIKFINNDYFHYLIFQIQLFLLLLEYF